MQASWPHLTPLYKVVLKESTPKKSPSSSVWCIAVLSYYWWIRLIPFICLFFNPFSPYWSFQVFCVGLAFPVTLLDELPGKTSGVLRWHSSMPQRRHLGLILGESFYQGEVSTCRDGCRWSCRKLLHNGHLSREAQTITGFAVFFIPPK